MTEDDIDFLPNCKHCVEERGFTELLPSNELYIQLWFDVSTQFVYDHKLEPLVLEQYKEEIQEAGGVIEVIRMLSLITKTAKDLQPKESSKDGTGKT